MAGPRSLLMAAYDGASPNELAQISEDGRARVAGEPTVQTEPEPLDEASTFTPTIELPPDAEQRLNDISREHWLNYNPTHLTPEQERQFQEWVRATPWFADYEQRYGEAPDLHDPQYDYRGAWLEGIAMQPTSEQELHWPSRSPSGKWLKGPQHPTAWKEYYQALTGRNPDDIGVIESEFRAALTRARREALPSNYVGRHGVYRARTPQDPENDYILVPDYDAAEEAMERGELPIVVPDHVLPGLSPNDLENLRRAQYEETDAPFQAYARTRNRAPLSPPLSHPRDELGDEPIPERGLQPGRAKGLRGSEPAGWEPKSSVLGGTPGDLASAPSSEVAGPVSLREYLARRGA